MPDPSPDSLVLHGYFRSSAAYRVRIALNLKGLDHRHVPVHLVRNGGEHLTAEFARVNPMKAVPVLHDGTFRLAQSLAIIEYLDERFPGVPLLPVDIEQRACARQLALMVACDIHPLNNPRVTGLLSQRFGADQPAKLDWMRHWMALGFEAIENELVRSAQPGRYCVGDSPGIADCCLIPQVFNARRFEVDLSPYPTITRIAETCDAVPAFAAAHPSKQVDAE